MATSTRSRAVPPASLPSAGRAVERRPLLHRVPAAVGVAVAVLAGAVLLIGWALDVDVAKGFTPAHATIRPFTAICLLLLAISLPLLARGGRRPRRIAMLGAGAALLISLLSLTEYVLDVDIGMDTVLFSREIPAGAGAHPGRMPLASALCVAFLAAAHLTLLLKARWSVLVGQLLAVGAGLLGVTAVYGTVYYLSFPGPDELGQSSGIALSSALAVTLLSAGTVAATPAEGIGGVLTGGTFGAMMGRRMFLAALTVPFILGWLPILARRDGLYGTRFGVAVLITGNAAAFALASVVSARAASRLETLNAGAQQEARDSHEKLVALIDNTSAVIYIRDLDGRYVLVNQEFERLFTVRRDEVVGKTDHELFPFAVAAGVRADDLAVIARGTPIHVEGFVLGEDGERTYVTVKFPLLDGAGQAYAVCGISTDITDRKRAEDKVLRLNAELETRVRERTSELEVSTRELDAFAYSVSHDLRAPLRSLNGYSEVLLEDYADVLDETGRGYLNRVQANAARMGQLIDGLLDLSRNSRVTLARSEVDLHELADEVVADLRAAEPDRAVEVVIADHLRTTADPALIRLVLQNLIGNAWKFSAGGTPGTIEVGSAEQDGEQVFFVRDNGAGFDMRYAAKLFEPFQRLHGGHEFEGSGLGLAIVQRIIARHGGRIWARGEPGGGAVFSFTTGARIGALR